MSNLMQSAKSVYSTGLNIEWSTPRRARTISSENGNLDILYMRSLLFGEKTMQVRSTSSVDGFSRIVSHGDFLFVSHVVAIGAFVIAAMTS